MKTCTLAALALMMAFSLDAQENPFIGETPPKAELGKCYAKCHIPSQYEQITEKVLVKEGATKLVAIPATYRTVTEQVLVKEATIRFISVPAEYESITDRVLVREAHTKLVPVSPVYDSFTERVLVSEATTRWVMKRDKNCVSPDPNDCYVAYFEEVPENYVTYTSSVLKTPATVVEVNEDAEYKYISSRQENTQIGEKSCVRIKLIST